MMVMIKNRRHHAPSEIISKSQALLSTPSCSRMTSPEMLTVTPSYVISIRACCENKTLNKVQTARADLSKNCNYCVVCSAAACKTRRMCKEANDPDELCNNNNKEKTTCTPSNSLMHIASNAGRRKDKKRVAASTPPGRVLGCTVSEYMTLVSREGIESKEDQTGQ